MKILQVHNYYQQRGGEDAVVEAEKALFEQHGHQVISFTKQNNTIQSRWQKIHSCLQTHHNKHSATEFDKVLTTEKPDIVHCHNTFPLISPAIYGICQKHSIPVIQTLHNFRIQCANGLLFRNGQICENCLTKNSTRDAIRYHCYRNSLIGSVTLAHYISYHKKHQTWRHQVNRFIALTDFAKSKFLKAGIDADQIDIKPNFIDTPKHPPVQQSQRNIDVLYIGRLSPEKGIDTLVQASHHCQSAITVIGEGPVQITSHNKNIIALGKMPLVDLLKQLAMAKMLIVPSIWHENFPRVIVEALSCGTPVITSNLGSLAEIVQHNHNGMLFEPGDSQALAKTINGLLQDPKKLQNLSNQAYQSYLDHYTPDQNYQQLMAIYQRALY